MPKKPSKQPAVNIQRLSEQRLLDAKIVGKSNDRLPYLATIAAAIGVLLGGGILGYLIFSRNPAEPNLTPDQVVPVSSQQPSETGATEQPTSSPAVVEPEVVIQEVEILVTPTGFLNVRSGPGTNFAQIGRASPGESYELVSQDQSRGWLQIRLSPDTTGWVSKQYARIK